MTVLGAHVPISWWTVAVLVIGFLVAGPTATAVAERIGWRTRPTVLAACLLAVTLAMTATPDPGAGQPPLGLAACIPLGWSDVPVDIAASGGGLGGNLLNIALYLPLAGALVIASGKLWPGYVVVVLPPALELAQTILPGRSCSVTDVLTNSAGIGVGLLLGWIVIRRRRVREATTTPLPNRNQRRP